MNKLSSLCLLLMTVFLFSPLMIAETINDTQETVSQYAQGKRLLKEGNYRDAAALFSEMEARFPGSPNLDLFIFNRSKAHYYDYSFAEAAAGFSYFINNFPASPHRAHAAFFLGNALYRQGEATRALHAYISAYKHSDNGSLETILTNTIAAVFANASRLTIGEADFNELPFEKKCRLMKILADEYLKRDDLKRSEELLRRCGETIDPGSVSATGHRSDNLLEVAVAVPLSGELQAFGEAIYNGTVIAAELYREETNRSIQLVPYDTKGDPIEAARIISSLAQSISTDIVIGPLTSEEAAVASATLSCADMPMIAPAATEAGLTRLSEAAFQLAPNIELEGIILADYAINHLNADSAAILSSTATEDIRMSRAFANRFRELGGTVVAMEYYRTRDKDFGAYIRDMKSIILGQPGDSTFYITPDGDTIDWDIVPVHLDCLFMPGKSSQLRQLVPQVHFYNVTAAYLGSDGWGDPALYKLGDNVTKRAVFASPFLTGKRSDEYLKLAIRYDGRFGEPPQRLATLGFDALRLVSSAFGTGNNTRQLLIKSLSNLKKYDGASGLISFGRHRENIEMPLYYIQNEQAIPVSSSQQINQQ